MEVDLNLENYNLQDLLNLFELSNNFNINDLKSIKKKVLQLHPDKSRLDKEYFLFYCKAYRMVKNIYDFKNKKQESLDSNNATVEYVAEELDEFDSKGKRLLLDKILKKEKADFNKWFNENFEKMNIEEEERKNGYGDWFKSNEDVDTTETTLNMMHQKITEKKEHLSSIVKRHDIQDTNYNSSSNYKELDSGIPESYSSNMFSKLPYEDLRKAHTETVVPVSANDYNKVLKFNNVETLRQHRHSQNIKPLTEGEASNFMSDREKMEDQKSTKLAYKLTREEEKTAEASKTWWGNLRLLN